MNKYVLTVSWGDESACGENQYCFEFEGDLELFKTTVFSIAHDKFKKQLEERKTLGGYFNLLGTPNFEFSSFFYPNEKIRGKWGTVEGSKTGAFKIENWDYTNPCIQTLEEWFDSHIQEQWHDMEGHKASIDKLKQLYPNNPEYVARHDYD